MAKTQFLNNNPTLSSTIKTNHSESIISITSNTTNKLNSILFKPTITKKVPSPIETSTNPQQQTTPSSSSSYTQLADNDLYTTEDPEPFNLQNNYQQPPIIENVIENKKRKKLKYSSEDSNQEDYEDEEYDLARQNEETQITTTTPISPTPTVPLKIEIKKEKTDKLKLNNTVSMKKKRKKLILKKFKHNKGLTDILLNLNDNTFDIFNSLISIEHDYNGGAKIITCKYDDLVQKLGSNRQLMKQFANYFLNLCYFENEKTKRAEYTLGIVHNCANCIPDILEYFSSNYPTMNVKSSLLTNNKEIITLKMCDYKEKVFESYYNGTYRYGPLLQTSIVGIKSEEIGGYFPEFIENYLEKNIFLRLVLPWGKFSMRSNSSPKESDDGPIIWSRPGEQMLPTTIIRELEKKHDRKKRFV
jgi:hypothetical protein